MKRFQRFFAVFFIISVIVIAVFLKTCYVVPVLMYHSIDYKDKITKLSVNPESFARQMEFLHKHKYNVVSLGAILGYIKNKERIPSKTVAITFDDGFYNNYEHAYPVLKKYGFPATIFIITGTVGAEGYLSWENIREMSDSGLITIGSHTVSHKWLPDMPETRLKRELSDSKKILEEKLGTDVDLLCYPVGAHDGKVKSEAMTAGYKCAVGTNPGKGSSRDDIYAIKRIRISRTSDNLFVFWLETSGYYTWLKEHRDDE